jgi:hypothetical protein
LWLLSRGLLSQREKNRLWQSVASASGNSHGSRGARVAGAVDDFLLLRSPDHTQRLSKLIQSRIHSLIKNRG